jgi:hypothetical protein
MNLLTEKLGPWTWLAFRALPVGPEVVLESGLWSLDSGQWTVDILLILLEIFTQAQDKPSFGNTCALHFHSL